MQNSELMGESGFLRQDVLDVGVRLVDLDVAILLDVAVWFKIFRKCNRYQPIGYIAFIKPPLKHRFAI